MPTGDELHLLYIHIHILYVAVSEEFFFFAHSPIKYDKFLNRSIWPIDNTQTGTTNSGQKRCGSNGNEGVLHTPQICRTGASPSNTV